jgi:hypothetical protein
VAVNREKTGLGKPEPFNFLGFTFVCGKLRGGKFLIERMSRRDRVGSRMREAARPVLWGQ